MLDQATKLAVAVKLVFTMISHVVPGAQRYAERAPIAGLARAAVDPALHMTPKELAELSVYGELEGQFRDHPHAYSWDAKGGVSCGYLQEPCWYVKDHDDEAQARWWIHNVRAAGLADVDSSAKRANYRARIAVKLLQVLEECPWHRGMLGQVFEEQGEAAPEIAGLTLVPTLEPTSRFARLRLFITDVDPE